MRSSAAEYPIPGWVSFQSATRVSFASAATASLARGGTLVVTGGTTGLEVQLPLLPMLSEQIIVCGSIMGTLQDMRDMMSFIVCAGIKPEIGQVIPMERAAEAFRAMWQGGTYAKTVFTR
jgi:D-arabinose 1-dehydrogenase-like Zn-dependent alcohol dehydrogenase